jgi:hypothetical protein
MLKHTNMKSLDLTEIHDKSRIRKNQSIQHSINSILNKNFPLGDDSIFNDSLLNQSKHIKLNESANGKYAKLLDPSFLKEDDQNQTLIQKNNSTNEFENYDNVPPKLLRLLTKNKSNFDGKISERNVKDIIKNAQKLKPIDVFSKNYDELSRLEDQFSNRNILSKFLTLLFLNNFFKSNYGILLCFRSNIMNSKLTELKSQNSKLGLNSKDISYIQESSYSHKNNGSTVINDSSMIKNYYKDETKEYSMQV